MNTHHLSALSLWILLVLAEKPAHAYAIRDGIMVATLMGMRPHPASVRSALKRFERQGWVELTHTERGNASVYSRQIYAITTTGSRVLREQISWLRSAVPFFDRLNFHHLKI